MRVDIERALAMSRAQLVEFHAERQSDPVAGPFTEIRMDGWEQEEFEDEVAAVLIAIYESKLARGAKRLPGAARLRFSDILRARQVGPYLPHPSRIICAEYGLDLMNDRPPAQACFSMPIRGNKGEYAIGAYRMTTLMERVERCPPLFKRTGGGPLYRVAYLSAKTAGVVDGEIRYFSIKPDGQIAVCDAQAQSEEGFGRKVTLSMYDVDPHVITETEFHAKSVLQFETDRRFCWQIEAREEEAHAYLGVTHEEIKSLLYARSLPLTATGRKRPVLHLVSAHKRRLRNGIDIDISEFLRGTREVVMDGTMFRLHEPQIVANRLAA